MKKKERGIIKMPERTLKCMSCGASFVFTESEQTFYREKGFENEPKRCKDCRKKRKDEKNERRGFGRGDRSSREGYEVVCNACGKQTTVPFKPIANRPVLCKECFRAQKES